MSVPTAPPQAQRSPDTGITVYVRRNIWKLTSDEKPWDPITEAYAKAVAVMQQREVRDRTSWIFQANMHWTYDKDPDPLWNQCPHGSWFFLPWHRLYVYHFEQIVRAIVRKQSPDLADTFAIPFWNYYWPEPGNTGPNRLPPPFRQEKLPDGTTPNPLYIPAPGRNAPVANGDPIAKELTDSVDCLEPTEFTGSTNFGGLPPESRAAVTSGRVERTPHNSMHVTIGGRPPERACGAALVAQVPCAARDPIFWLHHANIDRLWDVWLGMGQGRRNPDEPRWLDQQYTFVTPDGQTATMKVRDGLNSFTQLHYVYESDIQDMPVPQEPPAEYIMATTPSDGPGGAGGADEPPSPPPELVGASPEPVELAGGTASVGLDVPANARAVLDDAAPADSRRSIYLTVENLEAEQNPGVVYGVYLEVPHGGQVQRHYVGNLTAFGIETMNDPEAVHSGTLGHIYDVTDLVGELSASGDWDPDAVKVTFEPLDLTGGTTAAGGPEVAEAEVAGADVAAADVAVPPLRVGRVGLFVD